MHPASNRQISSTHALAVSTAFRNAEIFWDPFPLAVVDSVLPSDPYRRFVAALPNQMQLRRDASVRNTDDTSVFTFDYFANLSPTHSAVVSELKPILAEVVAQSRALQLSLLAGVADRESEPKRAAFLKHWIRPDELEPPQQPLNVVERLGAQFGLGAHTDGPGWFAAGLLYATDDDPDQRDGQADESMGLWTYALHDTDDEYDPWVDWMRRFPAQGTLRRARYIPFKGNRLVTFLNVPWSFHGNDMRISGRRLFIQLGQILAPSARNKIIERIGTAKLHHLDKFGRTQLKLPMVPATTAL